MSCENINLDLFWASRGGGGGQFGVVISMQVQSKQMQDKVVYYSFKWPLSYMVKVFSWWQMAIVKGDMFSHFKILKIIFKKLSITQFGFRISSLFKLTYVVYKLHFTYVYALQWLTADHFLM